MPLFAVRSVIYCFGCATVAISRVEFRYKKPHLRYDPDAGLWIGYRVDVRAGKKRHRPTFRTRAEAEQFASELRVKKVYAGAGLKPERASGREPRVSELFAERLKEITNHASLVRAKRVFAEFETLLDRDLRVTEIRRAHFREYIKGREGDGVKAETINREINELSAALNRAPDLFPRDLEDYLPQIARPKIKRGKREHREITEAEAVAIAATIRTQRKTRELEQRIASRPAVAGMFELAWYLGLRIGETEKLLKTDYDTKTNSLRVVRWKTKTRSMLPHLPERVVEILIEAIEASPTEYIFHVECSRHTVEAIISDACAVNKIPYGRGKVDAITFHSTRHSFTSRLVRVTDPATAASFTGHSSQEMLDYYSHASDESRRRAMDALYGTNGNSKLHAIFKMVRAKKMDFEEFIAALK